MTASFSRREFFWVRQYLIQRDGARCLACGTTSDVLDVDHLDGNPTNNSPNNLRLLCRSCNTSKGIRRAQGIVTFLEREGENAGSEGLPSADATTALKARIDYSNGSPEMQVNDAAEGEFRKWVVALLLKYEDYPLKVLIEDGAEWTGTSLNAIRNYLRKMCSRLYGPLETFRFAGKGPTHVRIKVRWKEAILRDERTPTEVADGLPGGQ